MSCNDRVNANVPCFESFHYLFDILDESNYPWQFKFNLIFNESNGTASRRFPSRPYNVIIYNVITGQENVYVNNSWQNGVRAMDEVSICLFCQNASNDMQHGIPVSFNRSRHLTWSEIKFSYWPFGVKLHICGCVFKRGIGLCFAFLSTLLSSKVICIKRLILY